MGPFRGHQSSPLFFKCCYLWLCQFHFNNLRILPLAVVRKGKLFTTIQVSQAYMKAFHSHHKPTVPTFRQGKSEDSWKNSTVLSHIKGSFPTGTHTHMSFLLFHCHPRHYPLWKSQTCWQHFHISLDPRIPELRAICTLSCLELPKVPLSSSVSSSMKWDYPT